MIGLRLLMLLLFAIAGCSPEKVQQGEFPSLQSCLSSIESATGYTLDLLRDTPEQVSGYLQGTDHDFACEKKSTGTRGVIYIGWYEEPEKVAQKKPSGKSEGQTIMPKTKAADPQ